MFKSRNLVYMLIIISVFLLLPINAYAKNVTSDELINNAKEFDGKQVAFTGEVIGDIMKRGDYAWINVSDGSNAIGIFVPYQETKKIHYTGSYKYKGDTITVTGTFHRACAQHGGDMDIHSDAVQIVKKGYKVQLPVNSSKIYTAAGLLLVSALLLGLVRKRKA